MPAPPHREPPTMAGYARMFVLAVVSTTVTAGLVGLAISPSSWPGFVVAGALLGVAMFALAVCLVRLSWREKG